MKNKVWTKGKDDSVLGKEHCFRWVTSDEVPEEVNGQNRSRKYTFDRSVPITLFGCRFGCDGHRALLGENFCLLIPAEGGF